MRINSFAISFENSMIVRRMIVCLEKKEKGFKMQMKHEKDHA